MAANQRSVFGKLSAVFGSQSRRDPEAFLAWEDYSERMAVLDLHSWQQATRRQSLRNLATSDL